jgi:hypothetical protein
MGIMMEMLDRALDGILIFSGIVKCYECNGASGERAYRTKGGACLCVSCRDSLLKSWGIEPSYEKQTEE